MSMFYCEEHDRVEDSDYVGYNINAQGDEVCDEGLDRADIRLREHLKKVGLTSGSHCAILLV
jgi:hypothetical protein